jgi:hypothetical protein
LHLTLFCSNISSIYHHHQVPRLGLVELVIHIALEQYFTRSTQ